MTLTPPESPRAYLMRNNPEALRKLSSKDLAGLHSDWPFWAWPDQLAPAGAGRYWLVLAEEDWQNLPGCGCRGWGRIKQ